MLVALVARLCCVVGLCGARARLSKLAEGGFFSPSLFLCCSSFSLCATTVSKSSLANSFIVDLVTFYERRYSHSVSFS